MFHVKLHPQGVLGFQRKDQEKKGKKENKRIKRESGGGRGEPKKQWIRGGRKPKKIMDTAMACVGLTGTGLFFDVTWFICAYVII